jgi:hypothetical protein
MIRISLLAVLLVLAGCAYLTNEMTWTKPGVTEAEAQSDLGTCTDLASARTEADREIDQDIAANQPGSAGYSEPIMPETVTNHRSRQKFNDILNDCMAGLGYGRVE